MIIEIGFYVFKTFKRVISIDLIMQELEIKIHGRVQGVLFRERIKRFAKNNQLNGFVENLADGSVLVLVQGNKENLDKLTSWLKSFKGICFVRDLKIKETKILKKYSDFKILKKDSYFLDKFKSGTNLIKSFQKSKFIPPLHLVIIPDGNRRWAKKRGLEKLKGHDKAADFDNLFSLFNEARGLGVKYVSLWGFSTENWKRGKEEIDNLFKLFFKNLEDLRKVIHKHKIRFRHFGRKDRFPKKLKEELVKLEKESKNYSDFNIQFCLDYGGRDEIVRAVNKILNSKKKKIDEEDFKKYLDSSDIPDPDMIIRTSGEQRLSGIMPYQGVYAELCFVKKHFPSFKPRDLRKAIKSFGKRKRRFGGS